MKKIILKLFNIDLEHYIKTCNDNKLLLSQNKEYKNKFINIENELKQQIKEVNTKSKHTINSLNSHFVEPIIKNENDVLIYDNAINTLKLINKQKLENILKILDK